MTRIASSARDPGLPAGTPDPPSPEPSAPGGEARARDRARRWPSLVPWLAVAVGVLVLPFTLAVGITWSAAGSGDLAERAAAARIVSASDLAQAYGIKVNLVGVTAAGGLVDVRVTILDKDKAEHLFHDQSAMPALFVEDRGAVLRAPHPLAHKITLLDGASYFFLYPNSGGVVQAGTSVSLVIDEVRSEPVSAQS
jgi:hypothetical protein